MVDHEQEHFRLGMIFIYVEVGIASMSFKCVALLTLVVIERLGQ